MVRTLLDDQTAGDHLLADVFAEFAYRAVSAPGDGSLSARSVP